MNKTKRIFLIIFICFSLIFTMFLSSYITYKNVYADNVNVNLSNTDKCQKSVISSTLTSQQYTDVVNNLTDTTYRNGSYFVFNETLTFNNRHFDNNANYYFLYRGAFYYDINQFSSYSNAVTLFNQNIGSAYSIGKYRVFSFGGHDFFANLYIRNEGVWSSSSQWNNGEFLNGFFLFFDASTLSYEPSYSTSPDLKEFSINNDNIVISADININQTLAMFGVHFYNIPQVSGYSTGSNSASYSDINFIDIYNVWNLNLHNKANNKFYDHINRITFTKLETDFNINISYNVTNKYNFSTIYLALNTGSSNYPNVTEHSIITNFRFNFYNDLYNFYDIPDTRSLIKYSFSNDLTAYLTDIDYIPVLNYWGGDLVKYDNTKFKVNGFIDNSLYFAYDGKINNSFIVNYVDSDNTYSQNLYRNNVEWYDIFGHLYNFLIYLIFDMPLISNITQPIYFIINSAIVTIGWVGGIVAGLGIFGAFGLVYLLFTIIRRNI